ncbi:hypothetical protein NXH64_08715 [Butyrivibrio fibrisolvens]|uniref:hypothetical protein n=1 Tax=Pseudobutyrivibrio ruminis TaxID=46206 RepID=UPI000483AC6D|nr:hypothetical protein [Pseudobutyrivibrio ruminis]MDC7279581.1 hypothetical protein [Butyrivibrio fibrisolvens]
MNNGIDLEKIKHRITKTVSTEEVLKCIEPFDIPQEVLDGESELIGTSSIVDEENCGIFLSMELKSCKEQKPTKEMH